MNPNDHIIVQKDGSLHQLALNLEPLRNIISQNSSGSEEDREINIAVHLGKNASYNSDNYSISIYKYENVVPNFFLALNRSVCRNVPSGSNSSMDVDNLMNVIQNLQVDLFDEMKKRSNASVVLMYQHNLGGYLARDCLISEALRRRLITSDVPLNTLYRTEWEQMSKNKKSEFQFLYGPLSFGVCENLDHKCIYLNVFDHPVDRALQMYYLCSLNASLPLCSVNKINETFSSATDFITHQGSVLFQKLLYYSRHCKLVGRDEVCIHDPQSFFLLSRKEKLAYLSDILDNLEGWFSVVGLVDHFQESVSLIQYSLGWNLTSCNLMKTDLPKYAPGVLIDGFPYEVIREKLLNDSVVIKSIGYDLAIYAKLEDIFSRQTKVYDLLQALSLSPTAKPLTGLPVPNNQKLTDRIRRKMKNLYKAIKPIDSHKYLKYYDSS